MTPRVRCCSVKHSGTHTEFRKRKILIERKYQKANPFSTWSEERKQRRRISHARATIKMRRVGQALVRELKNKPCADCGKFYGPHVMDFDHVRGIKSFNLSQRKGLTAEAIRLEAAKCDIVCANCHREREWRKRGSHY